ncbi:Rhodanese-like domain-containing protein 6 [Striga hermonthica]|uniref:Rhodanese-like domain-containing protein 6 n=1 Tax=Striga hermonthica TaxID=68872 RepID=A0A9N7REM6_STRHE|nr:Rhodanese-like domain-containing protein 6 [Striga hermonthica]
MAEHGINLQLENEKEKDYGVLLYYKYTSIPDLQSLFDFYSANCTSLSLLGRVRLSSHGVNVTVGGRLRALEEHIEAVKSNALFEGTDFKLASCLEPLNDQVAKECGFTSLSIRIVKELVTLSSHPLLKSPEISNAGRHLSAAEFHSILQSAGKCQDENSSCDKKLILLDARNLYETRIGKFETPDVKTLDPEIRQYSDLPSWIDNNSEKLRGNNILMYCTGGIRCEMASAYIRSKGAGFENVFQLYGGIQRYMEQFPDGGFFKGKNFVFDHRVSVGSLDSKILGSCLLCGIPFDDYTSRCRCIHCRMLVLICDGCREISSSYVCELCQKNGKPLCPISVVDYMSEEEFHDHNISTDQPTRAGGEHHLTTTKPTRKLRILCLHGFRQNASSFKGRTASFAKKLKNIAEFVFLDGPHELPFIYQHQNNPPNNHCNKKFAWLVSADYDSNSNNPEWKMAETPFDSLQYQQQTSGFDKSIDYLKTVFSREGPFDGILGFSQGAAMAALVSACKEKLKGGVDFRFVILCSGFAVNMEEFAPEGSINCPSLHIFGNKDGRDRQIDCRASRHLASFFEKGCSVVVEHDLGHIIPTRSPYIEVIRDFLGRFL